MAGFDFYTLSNPLEIDSNTEYTLIGGNTTLGVVLSFTEYDDNNNIIVTHDNVTTKTFTTSPTTTKLVGGVKRYSNSITINNFIVKPMLIKGNIIHSEYVPYNSIEFKAHNRNFINNNDLNYISTNISASQIFLTTLDTGIRFTTTFKSGGVPSVTFRLFDLTPYAGKTIRIKATFASNGFIRLSRESDDRNQKITINTIPSNTIYSFDVPNDISSLGDAKYFCYALGINNPTADSTTVDFTDLILTIDDEDMTYVPHQEQTSYFTFEEGQYLAEGDYLADDGIHKVWSKITFDGTENWQLGAHFYCLNILQYYAQSNEKIYSNFFKFAYPDASNDNCIFVPGFTGQQTKNIWIKATQYETVNDFTTWLATQYANGTPVICQYQLVEEIVIPYTPNQQAQWNAIKKMMTYKGTTNIIGIGNLNPNIEAIGIRDINSMFENLDNRLSLLE